MTLFEPVLGDLPGGVVVVEVASGEVRGVNDRYVELSEVDREAVTDRHVSRLFADDRFSDVGDLSRSVAEDGPVRFADTLRTAADADRPVTLNLSTTTEDGDDLLVVSVREREATAASRSDQDTALIRRLSDNVRDVLWVFTADWSELVYVNDAYERVWGRTTESLHERPRSFLDGVHPDDRERVREWMARLSDGESVTLEYRVLDPDGEESVVWVDGEPITGADGSVAYVGGFCREVTERRRQRRELERQRRLFEAVPVGVFRIGTDDGELLEANPAMASMLGADTVTELLGRRAVDFLVDESLGEDLLSRLHEEEALTVETQFTGLDGVQFWGRVTAVRHTDGEGQSVADGVVEDITDRRERREQLMVIDRILRHNVRNDVSVVLGYANYIRDNVTGDLAEAADTIRSRALKLSRTAEKERAIVSHLSDGQSLVEVDLVPTVERVLSRFREADSTLTVETDLPDAAPVTAHPDIDTAVAELVENAVAHHPDDPVLHVAVEAGPDQATVHFRDDGPGMPADESAVLTDEPTVEPLAHGSGTGLWLVRWLVKLSGGTVAVDADDDGTIVSVSLPTCEGRSDDEALDESDEQTDETT